MKRESKKPSGTCARSGCSNPLGWGQRNYCSIDCRYPQRLAKPRKPDPRNKVKPSAPAIGGFTPDCIIMDDISDELMSEVVEKDARRIAEMYVLTRVGKLSDEFVEIETKLKRACR